MSDIPVSVERLKMKTMLEKLKVKGTTNEQLEAYLNSRNFTVIQLRAQLEMRSLSSGGKKAELAARLSKSLIEEAKKDEINDEDNNRQPMDIESNTDSSGASDEGNNSQPRNVGSDSNNNGASGKGNSESIDISYQEKAKISSFLSQSLQSPVSNPTQATVLSREKIQEWEIEDVVKYLKGQPFYPRNINDNALKVLMDQEIGGGAFLGLTEEKLRSYGMLGGPADVLAKHVAELNDNSPDISNLPYEALAAQNMLNSIKKLSYKYADYANPENVLDLPFPFVGDRKPVDRFAITTASFRYMGREKFVHVLQKITELGKDDGYCDLFVYGTIGYGKSHILAAMTCCLIQHGIRVVYIPDCRVALRSFPVFLKSALYLTFGDSPKHQLQILKCKCDSRDYKDFEVFCNNIAQEGIQLYFIVDQVNAFDSEGINKDVIDNDTKAAAFKALFEITVNHYLIRSASANYKTAMYIQTKQRSELDIKLYGGYSECEMKKWWDHNRTKLPEVSKDEEKYIEEITGCIPLLLRPLFRYQGKNFEEVENEIFLERELRDIIDHVENFTNDKSVFQQHVDLIKNFLLGVEISNIFPDLYDNRYFYIDKLKGHIVCGLARDTTVMALRNLGKDLFFGDEWIPRLYHFENNPTMLGFIVKQMCLSRISHGLTVGYHEYIPQSTIVFKGPIPTFDTNFKYTFYVPFAFNFEAIDACLLKIDEKNAHLVPIQITIGKKHKNSAENFLSNWSRWVNELHIRDFQTEVTFVWIMDNIQQQKIIIPEKKKELRSRFTQVHPNCNVEFIPLSSVHGEADKALKNIRSNYK